MKKLCILSVITLVLQFAAMAEAASLELSCNIAPDGLSCDNSGVYTLKGVGFTNIVGVTVVVQYENSTLQNPQITKGAFLLPAQVMRNPNNTANSLKISAATSNQSPLNGTGVLATIKFTQIGAKAGKVFIQSSDVAKAPNGDKIQHSTKNPDDFIAETSTDASTKLADLKQLNVSSLNPASGVSMTISPNDYDGNGNGATQIIRAYKSGTSVSVTAPSKAGGNNFSSWNGCSSASGTTCYVTMSGIKTVIASYTTPTQETTPPPTADAKQLTVTSSNPASGVLMTILPNDNSGNGSGSTQLVRTFKSGTSVSVTAPSTSEGNNFSSWSGCNSASGTTCYVTMTDAKTVTASYIPPAQETTPTSPPQTDVKQLTVTSSNPAGGVSMAISPNDNGGNGSGPTLLLRVYKSGTSVMVTAPSTVGGNNFNSWSGCNSTSGTTCYVTMTDAKTVTAAYILPAQETTSPPTPTQADLDAAERYAAELKAKADAAAAAATLAQANAAGASVAVVGGASVGTIALPADQLASTDRKTEYQPLVTDLRGDMTIPLSGGESAAQTAAVQKPGANKQQERKSVSYKGVLQLFREFKGEKSAKALIAIFADGELPNFSQAPLAALSDGVTPVRLTLTMKQGSNETPKFMLQGASLQQIGSAGEEQTVWTIDAIPKKGVYEARLTVIDGQNIMEYPLVVAPPIAPLVPKAQKFTEADFPLYLSKPARFDLNKDQKFDSLDDYIFTANYIAALKIKPEKLKKDEPKPVEKGEVKGKESQKAKDEKPQKAKEEKPPKTKEEKPK